MSSMRVMVLLCLMAIHALAQASPAGCGLVAHLKQSWSDVSQVKALPAARRVASAAEELLVRRNRLRSRRDERYAQMKSAERGAVISRSEGKLARARAEERDAEKLREEIGSLERELAVLPPERTEGAEESAEIRRRFGRSREHQLTVRTFEEWDNRVLLASEADVPTDRPFALTVARGPFGEKEIRFPCGRAYTIYRRHGRDYIYVRYGNIRKTEGFGSGYEARLDHYASHGVGGREDPSRPRYRLAPDGTLIIDANGHHRVRILAQTLSNNPRPGSDRAFDDTLIPVDIADLVEARDWRGRFLVRPWNETTYDTPDHFGLTATPEERQEVERVQQGQARAAGWSPRPDRP